MVESLIALLISFFGSANPGDLSKGEVEAVVREYQIPTEVVSSYFQDGNGQITFGENSVMGPGNTTPTNEDR